MKKSTIPDFSRKHPTPGAKANPAGGKAPVPHPNQPQKPPTKSKTSGRRGG